MCNSSGAVNAGDHSAYDKNHRPAIQSKPVLKQNLRGIVGRRKNQIESEGQSSNKARQEGHIEGQTRQRDRHVAPH